MDPGPDYQLQIMGGYEIMADGTIGEVLVTRFFPVQDMVSNQIFFGGSPNFKDVQNPVADFILASTPGGFDGAIKNNTPVTTECEIHWVVKLLNATVLSGQLTEEVLGTLQFESDLAGPYSPWDGLDSGTYLANFSMTLPDPHSFTEGISTFGLDNITAFKVYQVWVEIAPSTVNLPAQNDPLKTGPVLKFYWPSDPTDLVKILNPVSPMLPWDAPNNVTQQMAEAVTVMNQVLRRNTLSQRHRHDVAVGHAMRYVVLVEIKWVWLSLPIILLLLSLMFLVATVVRSTQEEDKIGIFKTSVLAVLFNGLGEDVQAQAGGGHNRMGYTRSQARDMKVHLDDD
jgi:hypothetical protein